MALLDRPWNNPPSPAVISREGAPAAACAFLAAAPVERGANMKRNVNPMVAVVAIVAAVAIAAVVWVHGLAPQRQQNSRAGGFGGLTIKPRDIKKARENAKKARDKYLSEARRGAREVKD
jgi:uncharacterized protein HemX